MTIATCCTCMYSFGSAIFCTKMHPICYKKCKAIESLRPTSDFWLRNKIIYNFCSRKTSQFTNVEIRAQMNMQTDWPADTLKVSNENAVFNHVIAFKCFWRIWFSNQQRTFSLRFSRKLYWLLLHWMDQKNAFIT